MPNALLQRSPEQQLEHILAGNPKKVSSSHPSMHTGMQPRTICKTSSPPWVVDTNFCNKVVTLSHLLFCLSFRNKTILKDIEVH